MSLNITKHNQLIIVILVIVIIQIIQIMLLIIMLIIISIITMKIALLNNMRRSPAGSVGAKSGARRCVKKACHLTVSLGSLSYPFRSSSVSPFRRFGVALLFFSVAYCSPPYGRLSRFRFARIQFAGSRNSALRLLFSVARFPFCRFSQHIVSKILLSASGAALGVPRLPRGVDRRGEEDVAARGGRELPLPLQEGLRKTGELAKYCGIVFRR